MKHQHSTPEKELRNSLLEAFNSGTEDGAGGEIEQQMSGELNPRIQPSQAQGCVHHDSMLNLTNDQRSRGDFDEYGQ